MVLHFRALSGGKLRQTVDCQVICVLYDKALPPHGDPVQALPTVSCLLQILKLWLIVLFILVCGMSFHPSSPRIWLKSGVQIRLQRWARDKSLAFIPPDGRFVLAQYRFDPSAPIARLTQSSSQVANTQRDTVPIPFVIRTVFDLEDNGGLWSTLSLIWGCASHTIDFLIWLSAQFDITFTSRLTTHALENIMIEMNVGQGVGGIRCVAARGSGIGRSEGTTDVGIHNNMGTSWAFDTNKKVDVFSSGVYFLVLTLKISSQMLKWEIANAPRSSTWSLRGSFSTQSVFPPF